MKIMQHISSLALKGVVEGACQTIGVGVGERTVESVAQFLKRHFTDHSQALTKSLQRANDKAWKALEIALAGESLWSRFDAVDQKAFRAQIRQFLDTSPLDNIPGDGAEFRRNALQELRTARKKKFLTGDLEPNALAQQVGDFARFSDNESILKAEWQTIDMMARACHEAKFVNLAILVNLKPDGAQSMSLLVTAVRYFFRREVETDAQLFQGLAWAKFETLQDSQQQAFVILSDLLSKNHAALETALDSLHSVVTETHQGVQQIQKEISTMSQNMEMLRRELRPRDSLSISNDAERKMVKQLVARYRDLPDKEKAQFPELLNKLAKLEAATGSLADAQRDFAQAAELAKEDSVRAEAQWNLYTAALEQGNFGEALTALIAAAEIDSEKYAPFPLQKYRPERILGAGGFGVAFLCRNLLSDSRVVIKTLRDDALDRDVKEVFREARVLEELEHPAIIRLRDCDFASSDMTRPYLVMDYFRGQTLEQFVDEHGPLPAEDWTALVRPIAEALQVAHKRGIFHRDIKPGNLLVRRDDHDPARWRVKLIDFGLALKQNVLHSTAMSGALSGQTVTGYSIAGTLDYAAPEQLGKLPGTATGAYTDVYGLAKTSCFALFQTTQPLRKHWRNIPEALADLLEQCLSETPSERLADCAEVLQQLDELQRPAPQLVIAIDDAPLAPPVAVAPTPSAPTRSGEWWRDTAATETSGGLIHRFTGHNDAVSAICFDATGRFLLSGGVDGCMCRWDISAGEIIKEYVGHTDKIWRICNLADDVFLSASKDKSVRIWDSGKQFAFQVEELRNYPSRTNRTIAVSPDGQLAVTGNVSDGMIRLWELSTGRELRRLKGHMSWVLALDFSPNGRQLVSGSADGTIRLWDVHSGRELRRMEGHTDQVWSVVFAPNAPIALSSSADRTVRSWDLRSGRTIHCHNQHRDQVWNVAISPDGHLAASDTDDGSICIWQLDSNETVGVFQGHTAKVLSVAFSPDGDFLASAGLDKSICLWRIP